MANKLSKSEYNKLYKDNYYLKTRKIVTFALLNDEYEKLSKVADTLELTPNSYAKNIVINFLESRPYNELSSTQKDLIQSFIRQTRGVANNINQIAYQTNRNGVFLNSEMLLHEMKKLEDNFIALISNENFKI